MHFCDNCTKLFCKTCMPCNRLGHDSYDIDAAKETIQARFWKNRIKLRDNLVELYSLQNEINWGKRFILWAKEDYNSKVNFREKTSRQTQFSKIDEDIRKNLKMALEKVRENIIDEPRLQEILQEITDVERGILPVSLQKLLEKIKAYEEILIFLRQYQNAEEIFDEVLKDITSNPARSYLGLLILNGKRQHHFYLNLL